MYTLISTIKSSRSSIVSPCKGTIKSHDTKFSNGLNVIPVKHYKFKLLPEFRVLKEKLGKLKWEIQFESTDCHKPQQQQQQKSYL